MSNDHIAGDGDRRNDSVPDEFENGVSAESLAAFHEAGKDLAAALDSLHAKRADLQDARDALVKWMTVMEKVVPIIAGLLTGAAKSDANARGLPPQQTKREIAWGAWRSLTTGEPIDKVVSDVMGRIIKGHARA